MVYQISQQMLTVTAQLGSLQNILSSMPYVPSRDAVAKRQWLRDCDAEAFGTKHKDCVNAVMCSKTEEVTIPRVTSSIDTLGMTEV